MTSGAIVMAANKHRTIVVTGVTGKQGGAAFRHLKRAGLRASRTGARPERREHGNWRVAGVEVCRAISRSGIDGAGTGRSRRRLLGTTVGGGPEAETRRGIAFAEAANRRGDWSLRLQFGGWAEWNTGIPHFESKGKVEERTAADRDPIYDFQARVFHGELAEMRRDDSERRDHCFRSARRSDCK